MRLRSWLYCRIDGDTSGEARDSQMEAFNEPGSPIFSFLVRSSSGKQSTDIPFLPNA